MKRFWVKSFLEDLGKLLDDENFRLVRRKDRKNQKTLTALGYNQKAVQQELKTLTIADFYKGPEANEAYPGHIMVFGKQIGGKEVYIKLALTDESGENRIAVCISFHFAEHPLKYPFR